MKVKVIDPQGVVLGGTMLPVGTEHELNAGPHLDAWLRFKQVEPVKEMPAEKSEPAPESKEPAKKK